MAIIRSLYGHHGTLQVSMPQEWISRFNFKKTHKVWIEVVGDDVIVRGLKSLMLNDIELKKEEIKLSDIDKWELKQNEDTKSNPGKTEDNI